MAATMSSQELSRSKNQDALRTIGEVEAELDIAAHVLRFWESKFIQIKPIKQKGRRYYRPEDVQVITTIKKLLYEQGMTIKGAQAVLAENVESPRSVTPFEDPDQLIMPFSNISLENPNLPPPSYPKPDLVPTVTQPSITTAKIFAILAQLKDCRQKMQEALPLAAPKIKENA